MCDYVLQLGDKSEKGLWVVTSLMCDGVAMQKLPTIINELNSHINCLFNCRIPGHSKTSFKYWLFGYKDIPVQKVGTGVCG